MSNNYYISIDCNNTGRIIESYLLSNNLPALRRYNLKLNKVIDNLSARIEEVGGIIHLSGGDNILAQIGEEFIQKIILYVDEYTEPEIQFSIGLGEDAVSAYIALKYAKSVKVCGPVSYRNGRFIIA